MIWGNPFQIKKGDVTLVSQQKQNSQGIVFKTGDKTHKCLQHFPTIKISKVNIPKLLDKVVVNSVGCLEVGHTVWILKVICPSLTAG